MFGLLGRNGSSMSTDLLYIGLKNALLQDACALCWRMEDQTRRAVVNFLREGKSDGQVFLSLVRSFGLCQRHAWLLAEIEPEEFGDGMSTATLYEGLVTHWFRAIRWEPPTGRHARRRWWPFHRTENRTRKWAERLIEQLNPKDACHLCVQLVNYERILAWGLQRFLSQAHGDDVFHELFRKSWGLCFPHFRMVLGEVEDAAALDILIEVQRERMESVSKGVQEYLRKHDYRFAHEPYGPERDAWVRAIALFSGGMPSQVSTRHANGE